MSGELHIRVTIDPGPLTITKDGIFGIQLPDHELRKLQDAIAANAMVYAKELLALKGIRLGMVKFHK